MPTFDAMTAYAWPTQERPEEHVPSGVVVTAGTRNFVLAGSAVDAAGAPYVGALVKLFRKGDDSKVAETTSDGAGAWSFTLPENAGNFYVVAFDASGAPMGVTTNTLVAV